MTLTESAGKMSAAFLERFGRDQDSSSGRLQPMAKHVQLIAIGQGKPQFAAEFRDQFRFAGQIYVDPSKNLYTVCMINASHRRTRSID